MCLEEFSVIVIRLKDDAISVSTIYCDVCFYIVYTIYYDVCFYIIYTIYYDVCFYVIAITFM